MIDGLNPYPAMKDSGVPWLGEVPKHWGIGQLRRYLSGLKDGTHGTFERVADGPLLLSAKNVSDTGVRLGQHESRISLDDFIAITANGFPRPGDVLLTIVGTIGRCCVYRDLGRTLAFQRSVAFLRFADAMSAHFFTHYAQSRSFQDQLALLTKTSAQGGIYLGVLKGLFAICPPLPEQAAIVRFLDHADRRIRRYTRAKRKLIKLLEEQKQAIIHRAVTRGLDPNVRLKPSGVEWLGDVPEHWEVVPLCAIARPRKQTNQPHRELLSVYLGLGVIPFSAVEEKRTNPTSEDLSKYQVVEPGDFVLNNQQAWRGSVGVSRHRGIVSPAYLVLELDGRLLVQFADRLLPGRAMVAQYLVCSKGVGSIQRNLYWPHLRRVAVLVPPAVEQVAIARYLDDAAASLATAIERASREIDLLREYRTRLIADVVTGKLDVGEAAGQVPDALEELEPLDEIEAEGDADEAGADDADVAEEAEA